MLFRNKKGFTLVELLAVIVILAIILAIAIPSVGNIMAAQKKSAFIDSVKMIIHGIDLKIAQSTITADCTATSTVGCNVANYGGNPTDYVVLNANAGDKGFSFKIPNGSTVTATTITLKGATGGKFEGCTVTDATFTSVNDAAVSGC